MDILERQTDSIRGALNGALPVWLLPIIILWLNPAMNVRRALRQKTGGCTGSTTILTELVKQTELER
jgi:hypothetical protein